MPPDLCHGRPRAQRGRPLQAGGEVADRALARMQALSRPFGTAIGRDGDVGVVRL